MTGARATLPPPDNRGLPQNRFYRKNQALRIDNRVSDSVLDDWAAS
ncbi:MAG: hypothetical protein IPM54_39815 [Polyangiaceae bacterium]|nr:hypothetical protein [Polyangiaceae bacterium]MBK9265926.1 hypothetical protein [Polyangiaceae bacterium]